MKILRAFVLAAMLLFAAPKLNPQAPVPVKVEYVVGACGARNFTVLHGVLEETKLTFDSYMPDPGTVVAFEKPIVFDVKKTETKQKDEFNLDGVLENDTVEIHGILRNHRIAALTIYDGNLSSVLYGTEGDKDQMVKSVDADKKFCQDLHEVEMIKIPDMLNDFADHGSVKVQNQVQ